MKSTSKIERFCALNEKVKPIGVLVLRIEVLGSEPTSCVLEVFKNREKPQKPRFEHFVLQTTREAI